MVLGAQFTPGLDALGPVDDQRVSDATVMNGLFKVFEGRIACHRPASVVVIVGLGCTPLVIAFHVFLHGRLGNAVEDQHLIVGAFQSSLAAGPVVGGDHDQCVVQCSRAIERRDDAADFVVHMLELSGKGLHLAGVHLLLLRGEGIPCRDVFGTSGEFCARRKNPSGDLIVEDLRACGVPARVERATVFLTIRGWGMMRCMRRARCPLHHEGTVGRYGPVRRDPIDGPIRHVSRKVIFGLSEEGIDRPVVLVHDRHKVMDVSPEKTVKVVEAVAAGPSEKRAAG